MPASNPRIEELRKKFDENPRRYFAPLANEYRKAGDIDQAIAICRQHLAEQPGHMSGHIVFGQALYEAKQYDEARRIFEAALGLDPENLIALRHLGDIERVSEHPDLARKWYQRVLEADPRNEEIAGLLAQLPAAAPEPAEASAEAAPADDVATIDWSDLGGDAPAAAEPVSTMSTTLVMEPPVIEPPAAEPPIIDLAAPEEPAAPMTLDGFEATHAAPEPGREPTAEEMDDAFTSTAHLTPTAGIDSHMLRATPVEPMDVSPLSGLSGSYDGYDSHAAEQTPSDMLAGFGGDAHADPHAEMHVESSHVEEAAPIMPDVPEESPALEMMEFTPPPVESGAISVPSLASTMAWTPPPRAPEPEPAALPEPEPEPAPMELAAPETVEDAPQPQSAWEWEEGAAQGGESAGGPFVTETMAELYVKQGHTEQAIAVYRQLLERDPHDARLQARLAELETPAAAEPEALPPVEAAPPPRVSGAGIAVEEWQTMGALLSRVAQWRPGMPLQSGAHDAITQEQSEPAPIETPADVAPYPPAVEEPAAWAAEGAAESVPAPATNGSAHGGDLASLFAGAPVNVNDEAAARRLAEAFTGPGSVPSSVTGAPTRAATDEFSLDSVFRDAPRRSQETRRPSNFTFDQFFADGSSTASQAAAPGASEAPADADIEQFNSWLEGLKKK